MAVQALRGEADGFALLECENAVALREAGITDLMHQLVKDATFYNASSAPMSERTIHSVSVKSKRRGNAALSVSTSAPHKSR